MRSVKLNLHYLLIKNDTFILFLMFLFEWFLLILISHHINLSKFNHYYKSYDDYLKRTNRLEKSAFIAKNDLEHWLKSINQSTVLFNSTNVDFCVAILSKNRINSNRNYVIQSVMSLLTRVDLKKSNLSITLFNTEPNPAQNINALSLIKLIKIKNLSSQINHSNIRIKEAADYSLIIKLLHTNNCTYQLIIEDDAIAQFDWFEQINKIIKQIPDDLNHKWLSVKLFTGYKFYDWDWLFFKYSLLKVLVLSLALSIITYCMYLIHIKKRTNYYRVSKVKIFLIFVNSISIFVVFNTTCIAPVKVGIREYSTGFGGVSVLFNGYNSIKFAYFVDKVIGDILNGKSRFFEAKDLLIESFRREMNLTEFIMEPAVFQHTGMHSSLYERDLTDNGFKSMFKSFSFLDNDKLITFNKDFT